MMSSSWIFCEIKKVAEQDPEKVLFVNEDATLKVNYRDMLARANKMNQKLDSYGLASTNVGLICVPRGLDQVALMAGLMTYQRSALIVDSATRKAEIVKTFKSPFSYLIIEQKMTVLLKEQLDDFEVVESWKEFSLEGRDLLLLKHKKSVSRLKESVWMLQTSGSTGEPKTVMISWSDLEQRALSEIQLFNIPNGNKILNILSMSHDLGLNQLLTTILSAGTLEIFSHRFVSDFVARLQKPDFVGVTGIPNIWKNVILFAKKNSTKISHSIYLTVSGGRLEAEEIKQLHQIFPLAVIYKTYGQTETFRTFYEISSTKKITDFNGQVVPGVHIQLQDGELIHSGLGSFLGYWNQPEATILKKTLVGIKTGDYFQQDNQGTYRFLGRQDDLVKVAGMRFYLSEVEHVLKKLDEVIDAVVVVNTSQTQHHLAYEELMTFIRVSEKSCLTAEKVKQHCANNLDKHKIPTIIKFLDNFPMTITGKTDRQKLLLDWRDEGRSL